MRKRSSLFVSLAIAASLSGSLAARADMYTALDLGTQGGPYCIANGINNSGQVVGYFNSGDVGQGCAFFTGANGVGVTILDTLGTTPPNKGTSNFAFDINASGQVIGYSYYYAGSSFRHPFTTGANGVGMTDLGTLGAGSNTLSYALSVNASGQVVGASDATSTGSSHAFIWTNGVGMTDLGTLGGTSSYAYGIDSAGRVVGYAKTTDKKTHAFITGANGADMTDLGTLGGKSSWAYDINDSGQVIGYSELVPGDYTTHAFITGANGIGMTDLGTLGGPNSIAYGINASGQVVGYSGLVSGDYTVHAFVTGADGIGMTDLNSLVTLPTGDWLTNAKGINDLGQIVANSSLGHAYLLTPTPEPGSCILLLSGLGLIGVIRCRRRRA